MMFRPIRAHLAKLPKKLKFGPQKRCMSVETEEWGLFPREREGNVYVHNWSLVEDGVVATGEAFRNARLPVLAHRMGVKTSSSSIELPAPKYSGDFTLHESGDTLSHDAFNELFSAHQEYLSSGVDLFFEDKALGVSHLVRNGTRVITDSPAVALIARTLLANTPPREVDHRARFKGWNLDPRWKTEPIWTEDQYIFPEEQTDRLPGQRPIVAFVGGPGDSVAVQFVENDAEIVGANVVVGGAAPVSALIAALGHAGSVLINEQHADALALPSTCVTKGGDTVLIIGGGDDAMAEAAEKAGGELFGAYHNIMTEHGVSAMWNGRIGTAAGAAVAGGSGTPLVSVDGKAAVPVSPNNLAFTPKHVVIFEKGASKGKLSADEAIKRVAALTDEGKTELALALLKGIEIHIVGSVADLKSVM